LISKESVIFRGLLFIGMIDLPVEVGVTLLYPGLLAVEVVGGPRKFPLKPIPDPAEERDLIGQQENTQQDRQKALAGCDEHEDSGRKA
jgi:hypothetical protein